MGDLTIKIPMNSSEAFISTDLNGIKNHKTVSIDDLVSNLTAQINITTGLIPHNTRFFSGTNTNYVIGIESPPRVRRFLKKAQSAELPDALDIPYPRCLFIFYIKSSLVNRSVLFSLERPIMKNNDKLFRFPFGNTYENGNICWGTGNKIPQIKDPIALTSLIALFYGAPFNGDLYDERTIKSPSDKQIGSFWDLVSYLNGKEIFPSSMLYPSNEKLEKLIRSKK